MKVYSIQYENKKGEKKFYMNIGFDTPKEANDELIRILQHQADHKERGIVSKQTERTNFKIVPRNLNSKS